MNYTKEIGEFINSLKERTENDELIWEDEGGGYYHVKIERDENHFDYLLICPDNDNSGYDPEKDTVITNDICVNVMLNRNSEADTQDLDWHFGTRYEPFDIYREPLLELFREVEIRNRFRKDGGDQKKFERIKQTFLV